MAYNKCNLLLAGLLLTSSAAFSENRHQVRVEFDFRAGGAEMPAGTYQVTFDSLGSSKLLRLHNSAAQKSAFLVPMFTQQHNSKPHVLFQCDQKLGCSLAEVAAASGSKYTLTPVKPLRVGPQKITTVALPLQTAKGD